MRRRTTACRYSRGTIFHFFFVVAFVKVTVSAQLIGPDFVSPTEESRCWQPCKFEPDTNINVPETGCQDFYVCRGGRVTNRLACKVGTLFDVNIGACNHAGLVNCADPTCPPSFSPTESPSGFPTESPTFSPTESPTRSPTVSPTESPSESPTISPTVSPTPGPRYATDVIRSKKSLIEERVLKSYTASGTAYPSVRYTYEGFFDALQKMASEDFGADLNFKLWERDDSMYRLGLINVAAFLANAMVEAIYDDTCDELNWQQVAGRYAISNSCGQEGRSYQDETCGQYSCIVDPSMEITAVNAANDVRAPPPLECKPRSEPDLFSGYWDTNTGTEVKRTPYANTAGRIDVEGCCYWGRGVLLTRGSCNIGKLNYWLGARAAREGRQSLYPSIDFCEDPEATCSSSATDELRWTTALFEWSERVQQYNNDGWIYEEELKKFLDGGMSDDEFINSVGRILSWGCHAIGCSNKKVRFADDRKSNFIIIINDVFGIDRLAVQTRQPTHQPTLRPTRANPQNIDQPTLPMPTSPPPNQFTTLKPTSPQNLFTTPQPTVRPLDPYNIPEPTNPPFKYDTMPPQPLISGPQYPIPIILRPTPSPTFSTLNIDPPGHDGNTDMPTGTEMMIPGETIIPIEDNGNERSILFKCIVKRSDLLGYWTPHYPSYSRSTRSDGYVNRQLMHDDDR